MTCRKRKEIVQITPIKRFKVVPCIVTAAIMALIFFFSWQNRDTSDELSRGLTRRIAHFLASLVKRDGVSEDALVLQLHVFIRKMAHFTEYFCLGCSVFVAFTTNGVRDRRYAWFYAVIFCAFYAATDEIHQMFSDGRGAKVTDVMIDTVGAALGAGVTPRVYAAIRSGRSHGRNNKFRKKTMNKNKKKIRGEAGK